MKSPTNAANEAADTKKQKRPWTPEMVVGKARALYADQTARINERMLAASEEIRDADEKRIMAWLERVPETERHVCLTLLSAIGIEVPVAPVVVRSISVDDDEPSVSDVAEADETPSRPTLEEYDASGVMAPLSPERLAVAKGARR